MMVTEVQTGTFQGRVRFLEYGHFNKHLIFDTRNKDRVGKNILNILKLFCKNFSLNGLIKSA